MNSLFVRFLIFFYFCSSNLSCHTTSSSGTAFAEKQIADLPSTAKPNVAHAQESSVNLQEKHETEPRFTSSESNSVECQTHEFTAKIVESGERSDLVEHGGQLIGCDWLVLEIQTPSMFKGRVRYICIDVDLPADSIWKKTGKNISAKFKDFDLCMILDRRFITTYFLDDIVDALEIEIETNDNNNSNK